MKRRYRRGITASLLALLLALSLATVGCSDQSGGSSGNSDTSGSTQQQDQTQQAALPTELSQDDWVGAKQEVTLSTGINMKYVEMGQPDGDALIFLHGATDNSRSWSLIVSNFTDEYHVYMLDQRGHGDTDKPEQPMYTVSMYADDLAAFMDAKGIEKANVVGHSMGSWAAQTFAVNYPDRIEKLVLIGSAPVQYSGRDLYDAALSFGDNAPDDEFMEMWYWNPSEVDEDFLKREMEESRSIPTYAWRALTKGGVCLDLTPFMDELTAPTLILWGTLDGEEEGRAKQESLHELIVGSELIVYDGIGHNIQWEIPEKISTDIRTFLES